MKWIGRLWRGEYSLGKAFWLFGIVISIIWYFVTKFLSVALMVAMLFIGFSGPSAPNGLLGGSLFILAAMAVLTLSYQILAGVGIWRSAGTFPGKLAYAIFARCAVALYLTVFVGGIVVAVNTWFHI
jgi:hypothetical protein